MFIVTNTESEYNTLNKTVLVNRNASLQVLALLPKDQKVI